MNYLASLVFYLSLATFVTPAPLYDELTRVSVLPTRTNGQGDHLSFDLMPPEGDGQLRHYFRIDALGKTFRLNVSENGGSFLSPEHVVEYHHSQHGVTRGTRSDCRHFTGVVHEETEEGVVIDGDGWAAISYCSGLRGVIASETSGYLYIEPERGGANEDHDIGPLPHLLHTSPPGRTCSYEKMGLSQNGENSLKDEFRVRRSLDSASLSSEHWVEVAMVADHTMLEYHGLRELEAYLFTLMNMVAHLYRDPSIGHAMNIVVVRTVILENQQSDLSISTDALASLASFCSWQSSHLPSPSSTSPGQPDVSILVTRANICEGFGAACGTLGIAEFKGACSSEKSCSISEDIGLASAFTIAHELGHSLGIRHDGDMSVVCEPDNRFIMAPTFAQSHNPHIWSHCSRQQLAEFLLSPESSCLSNPPVMTGGNSSNSSSPLSSSSGRVPLPGLETTPTEQCQLMLGDSASHCGLNTSSEYCSRLWCREDDQSDCVHHHVPPASGTSCVLSSSGREGVCYQGACVELASLAQPVDGGWGEWGEWESCSLSCGTGIQGSSRVCDSPIPANGGRYCLGASHRHQTCNSTPCPAHSDIRQELCDSEPPHSTYTQWKAPSLEEIQRRKLDQCSHHCLSRPNNILFSLALDLPDGTLCLFTAQPSPSLTLNTAPVPESLGVCVSGECIPVDCSNSLHGMASRDACGVWCGNGSTCVPVSDTYTIPELTSSRDTTSGYIYHRAVTIPRGSGQVKISEIRQTDNLYLAATTPRENFNGNYRVKEGDLDSYWFAGAKWWYERPDAGIECLRTTGVVKEDVTIFIIANSRNLSIQYSAGVPLGNASTFDVGHEWRKGEWGRCEGVCGEGVRRRRVECAVSDTGIVVRDDLCDLSTKPLAEELCFTNEGCEYEWGVSPWSDCNTTCGVGEKTRTIHCTLTNNQTIVEDSYCDDGNAPQLKMECGSDVDCVYQWEAGEWGKCSSTCGEGERERDVFCVLVNTHTAVSPERCVGIPTPRSSSHCYSESGCVFTWEMGEWGDCSSQCGEGHRERIVSCILASNESVVSATHCEANSTSPAPHTPCYSEDGCSLEWVTGDWSECSAECGAGSRSRDISCVLTNNGTTVEEIRCDPETRPRPHSDCYRESGCVFTWEMGEWGDCSSQCGEGHRERIVSCILASNGSVVSATHCEANSTSPAPHTPCYSEDGCSLEWFTGDWSECSAECGAGSRSRDISCVLTNNGTTVEEIRCDPETRPRPHSDCYRESGCVFAWRTASWGECDSDCGWGERTRDTLCVLTNNDTAVDDGFCPQSRPETWSPCHSDEGCVYSWWHGNWTSCSSECGHGTRSREVVCYLTNNNTRVDRTHCPRDSQPAETSGCHDDSGCVYTWASEPWTNCSNTCGYGTSTRDVSCLLLNNETTVSDELCLPDSRPRAAQTCYSERECLFVWRSSEWSDCNAVCGGGHRERVVSCLLANNESTVDVAFCSENAGVEPASVTVCSEEECMFEWTVGDWGVCEDDDSAISHCDEGRKTRKVECTLLNNQSVVEESWCNEEDKPTDSSSCSLDGCGYVWVEGEWGRCDVGCGEGVREREVHCEQRHSRGRSRGVEEERCGGEKPTTTEACAAEPCLNFEWINEDWTTCDAECGEDGSQTRVVTCRHKNGTVVSESPYCTAGKQKPAESRRCRGDPCEVCVDRARTSCGVIVRLRLCHVDYLRDLCCVSCSS